MPTLLLLLRIYVKVLTARCCGDTVLQLSHKTLLFFNKHFLCFSPIPTYTKRPTKLPKSTTPRPILEEKNYEVAKKLPPSIKNHKSIWRIVWDAHIYFSGTLFVLLAIYCSVNILRLHTFSRLFSRNYFVSLNLCLVLIGILRPIWLFYDPYNVGNSWTRPVAYLLVDTGKKY